MQIGFTLKAGKRYLKTGKLLILLTSAILPYRAFSSFISKDSGQTGNEQIRRSKYFSCNFVETRLDKKASYGVSILYLFQIKNSRWAAGINIVGTQLKPKDSFGFTAKSPRLVYRDYGISLAYRIHQNPKTKATLALNTTLGYGLYHVEDHSIVTGHSRRYGTNYYKVVGRSNSFIVCPSIWYSWAIFCFQVGYRMNFGKLNFGSPAKFSGLELSIGVGGFLPAK